jgi:diacylglycerol kinase family enzyme
MTIYSATAPDGKVFTRESTRPLTFGIAHQSGSSWVINSFSYGTEATAHKRMNSLQKFYGGEWAIVKSEPQQNDN